MSDHVLSEESTMMELRDVLEHLRDDASDEAVKHSIFHTRHGDLESKAKAMYYIGQIELIEDLLWSLDGGAKKEGIEPVVRIRTEL